MNKVIIALFFTLSAAFAQTACESDLLNVLPVAEKLYSDYQNHNWAAIEGDVETLVPIAEKLLQDCAGVHLNDTKIQTCVDSVEGIARDLVPLVVRQDEAGLIAFLEQAPALVKTVYADCVESGALAAIKHKQDNAELAAYDMNFNCIMQFYGLVPLFQKIVADVQSKQTFDVISGDASTLIDKINPVVQACDIPVPSGPSGPIDLQVCADDILDLVGDIYNAAKQDGTDVAKILNDLEALIRELNSTLNACGVTVPATPSL